MSDEQQFNIRAATQTDVPFLADSWTAHLVLFNGGTRKRDVRPVVSALLQSAFIRCSVLVAATDPNFILGYVIYETFEKRNTVYWIHVKKPFQRFGLARRLIESAFGEKPTVTCAIMPQRNDDASRFFHKVCSLWEYNPLILARRMYAAGYQINHVSQPS